MASGGGVSRRGFVKQVGAAAVGANVAAAARRASAQANPGRRMNVVIITTDDNDADSLGCFGCPLEGVTPNMDRLASEGVRFEHAHTVSPTCQPSRLALMSGKYPQTNGNTGHVDPLRPGVTTLSAELKKAGYYTGIIGKQSNYQPNEAFDWDHYGTTADSFETVDDGYWGMWRSPEGMYNGTRQLIGEAGGQDKPFFLHLNTSDPHRPWPGSIDEVNLLTRRRPQWGEKALRPYPKNYSPMEVPVPGYLPDLAGVRVDLGEYYSALHNADKAVGRILDALEETGHAEDTIVICFGDQGLPMPPSKQNVYPFSTKIPLIVRWPGVTPEGGVVDHTMLEIIDIMPTLLDGLGLEPVADIEGRSLLPLFEGKPAPGRDRVMKAYNYAYRGVQCMPMRAAQTQRYTYIYNAWHGERNVQPDVPLQFDGHMDILTGLCWMWMKKEAENDPELAERVEFIRSRAPEEFYDLQADPHCLNNLIDAPEHADKIAELRGHVEQYMVDYGDPLLAKFRGEGPIPRDWLVFTPKEQG